MISKEYEPQDSRSYIIQLSPTGKIMAEQTSMFTEQLQVPIDNLNSDDKENLLLSLFNSIQQINQSGVITIQRMCVTCTHYKKPEKGEQHFCILLNQNLATKDLRIDCPEHLILVN